MRRRPTVLLDCDGVLADFVGGFLKVVNAHFGTSYKREDITQFHLGNSLGWSPELTEEAFALVTNYRRFADSLDVLPGAIEGVARLMEIADVHIVTSSWDSHETWEFDRKAWFRRHFGIGHHGITFTAEKFRVTGDMLIDDKTSTCEQWQAAWPDGLAVQWETPHNLLDGWDGARADSWNELIVLAGSLP